MDGSATTEFAWGDRDCTFRLGMEQLRKLQESTGAGPLALFNRLSSGDWKVDDVRETIRLGLIGGGMGGIEALKMVKEFVDNKPLFPNINPARVIIMAALAGPSEDDTKKKTTEKTKTQSGNLTSDD